VDLRCIRPLADDLEARRHGIETVAKTDPTEALDLLWRLMALASSVFERCDDSNGTVVGVCHAACSDIGNVAGNARTDPTTPADRTFDALITKDHDQFDGLIKALATVLRQTCRERLKQRMIDLSNRPVARPAEKDRVKIGWSSSGPIYADEMAERSRVGMARRVLQVIAVRGPSGCGTNR
jgi:hypothetical protein